MADIDLTLPFHYRGNDPEIRQTLRSLLQARSEIILLLEELAGDLDEFTRFRLTRDLNQMIDHFESEQIHAYGLVQAERNG